MSSAIRTQIGAGRRRLRDTIAAAGEIDTVEEVEKSSTEEVYQDIAEVVECAYRLRCEAKRILEHTDRWNDLIRKDPAEQKVMDDYKLRLGDYNKDLDEAKATLLALKVTFESFVAIHKKKSPTTEEYPAFGTLDFEPRTRSNSASSSTRRATSVVDTASATVTVCLPNDGSNPTIVPSAAIVNTTTPSTLPPITAPAPVPVSALASVTPVPPSAAASALLPSSSSVPLTLPTPPPGYSQPMLTGYSLPTFAAAPSLLHGQFQSVAVPVQLPGIPLPLFTGDYTKYSSFNELFSSLIDNQPLDPITKFVYFRSALRDDALKLIEHIPLSAVNYPLARKTLHDQYGDILRIRHHLLRQLQDIPSAARISDVSQLQDFWSTVSTIFYQLKNLQPDLDNATTADIISRKLPKRYIERLYTGSNAHQHFIASQVLDLVRGYIQSDTLVNTIFNDNVNVSEGSQRSRVTTMSVQQSQQHRHNASHGTRISPPKSPCALCSADSFHKHEDCPKYKTAEDRIKKAAELKLCFSCLRTGHRRQDCTRSRSCHHCNNATHHPAICKRKYGSSRDNATPFSRNDRSTSQQGRYTRSPSPGPVQQHRRGSFNRGGSQGLPPRPRFDQRRVQFNTTSVALSNENDVAVNPAPDQSVAFTSVAYHITPPTPTTPHHDHSALPTPSDSVLLDKPLPVAMMAARVTVENKSGQPIDATVFFDGGSDRSYVSKDLIAKLKLTPVDKHTLHVQTFANPVATRMDTERYDVTFCVKDRKLVIPLAMVPKIADSITISPTEDSLLTQLMRDKKAIIPRSTERPDILIGQDYIGHLLGETLTTTMPNGTRLHQTDLGIIVTGRESTTTEEDLLHMDPYAAPHPYYTSISRQSPPGILAANPEEEQAALRSLLERFWSLESCGIFESPRTTDEELTAQHFAQNTTRDADGRYCCRWPYKDGKEKLPDNRNLAYYRLQTTLRRLRQNPELYAKYHDIILEQMKRGFIEVIPDDTPSSGTLHYLSHHPILKTASKTTKVRIVYDASARAHRGAPSLNDILFTGESLLPKLFGVLLRIRDMEILISGDIEKAFLMLRLHPDDRDACRFLWQPPDSSTVQCYRFLRVPFGVKTSPYLLNASIKDLLESNGSTVAKTILRNIYVDNVFYGVDSVGDGVDLFRQSREIFATAKMNLTQFYSNSAELNTRFAAMSGTTAEASPEQKVLGVQWNTHTDLLHIPVPPKMSERPTKRRVLRQIALFYDPYGFLSPVVLKGKLFFQRLWQRSADWDAPLTTDEVDEWRAIDASICGGEAVAVSRKYFSTLTTKEDFVDLMVFGDASDAAYGSVAYLRRISSDGRIETAFVASKTKVAPLRKALTIPQLELLSIERCAHLARTVRSELDMTIRQVYIWSDSLCSLDQVARNRASSVYGRNRLRHIQLWAPDAIFSHVPGRINPADILSRGASLDELRHNKLWWNGPEFLQEQILPIRSSSISPSTEVCLSASSSVPPTSLLNLDPHRFSSFTRLLNVVMLLLKVFNTNNAKLKEKAKIVVIRLAQQLHPPMDSTIVNLQLDFNEEHGIWFYNGRVPTNRLPYLPAHHIARLYVQEVHRLHMHSSPLFTLAKVRNDVWIDKGLSFIKKTIRNCRFCQLRTAKPTRQPDFPPLPSSRIKWHKPFTYCGLDYGGPLKAKNGHDTRSYWFLIFTCLTTRYTAIELVSSLSTDHLLAALRRLTSLYGVPKEIRTDNGTQMVMLSKVFDAVRQQRTHSSITSHNLPDFVFIPAHSPWSGGIYERMVALVKACLLKSGATKRLLTEDDLRTLLTEAEAVINARPLTYVDTNSTDITPLRPVDFVFPTKRDTTALHIDETFDASSLKPSHATVMENWMRTTSLTEYFNRRWHEDYLQLLQSRNQTKHIQSSSALTTAPPLGSVVIFEEEGEKRSNWPLGRIVEVNSRSAKIFCGRTRRVVERPFRKIYQPEIMSDEESATLIPSTATTENAPETLTTTTPTPSDSIATRTRSRRRSSTLLSLSLALVLFVSSTAASPDSSWKPAASPAQSTDPPILEVLQDRAIALGEVFHQLLLIVMAVLGLLIGVALLHTVVTVLYFAERILGIVRKMFHCIWLLLCTATGLRPRRRLQQAPPSFVLIGLLLMLPIVRSCNDIAHIAAQEEACYEDHNSTKCHVNAVSAVTVRTNGSTACINFHQNDFSDSPLVTLQITAEALISYCQKRTLFFSRDFKLLNEYVKRCDSAGSCSSKRCGSITAEEDLEELSHAAKSHPGYTGCDPGCGGLYCGCFFTDPACLFYRYYAAPSSSYIYEIFQCPTWTPRLRIRVELGKLMLTTELVPGVKFQLPGTNISITAVGLSSPSVQAHSATFISSYRPGSKTPHWTAFTFTQPSAPGAPAKGFVGEFHANDRKAAEDFKGKFDRDLCSCRGFGSVVNCQCERKLMADYGKTNRLPSKGHNHEITTINDNVVIVAVEETLVNLQVQLKNATISRFTHVLQCEAKQLSEMNGCHSCFKGGIVMVTCHSKRKMKGLLHCGVMDTSLNCGPDGLENSINVAADSELVRLNCSLDCGKRTYLTLEGRLDAESLFNHLDNATHFLANAYQRVVEGGVSLLGFISSIKDFLFSSLVGPIILFIVLLGAYCALLIFRIYLGRFIASRRRRQNLESRRQFF